VENSDPHFKRKLRDVAMNMITASFSVDIPEESEEISYSFIVSGSIDALSDWIKSGYASSERMVGKMLYALCEGALGAVCKG
ncbi:MAG: TetR family transcriptional regulator C-terminal domain-containing protein, partial [Clostridiales bacterium]|nr:TetR family transcriptional regulator C-terminal domain-containing protein [Clostridiales bacterium]